MAPGLQVREWCWYVSTTKKTRWSCAQVLLLWLGMPLVKQWAAAESDEILGPKKWIIMGTLLGSAACVAQLATCHVVVLHMYVPNTHTYNGNLAMVHASLCCEMFVFSFTGS